MVEVTRFELATSTSRTNLYRFFPYFTRLFGAFESEIDAFRCSRKHCFHIVQLRRWSKVWSTQNSKQKKQINISEFHTIGEQVVHHVQIFSSVVSLAYYQKLVKSLSSTRKNWGAVVKEKNNAPVLSRASIFKGVQSYILQIMRWKFVFIPFHRKYSSI